MPMTALTLVSTPDGLQRWLAGGLESLPWDLSRRATVLLPSSRIGQRLRRDLCRAGHAGLLIGVRFVSAEHLAHEILVRGGEPRRAGLSELRPVALAALFRSGGARRLGLTYFAPDRLETRRGYPEAIVSSIDDLERAGIAPRDLREAADDWTREPRPAGDLADPRLAANRVRDTAVLWEAVDADLLRGDPDLRSRPASLTAAARLLDGAPPTTAFLGRVFAILPPQPASVLLRFIASLRPHGVALFSGRPVRRLSEQVIDRVGAALQSERPAPSADSVDAATELGIVRTYLFSPPDVLADPDRPRSRGADGTIALEQYPGIQEEIDAATSWVLEEVIERGTPLEDIAVIVPAREIVPLVLTAIERRDKGPAMDLVGCHTRDAGIPGYAAGGLPLSELPSGSLLLQLLTALHASLEAEQTIPLLAQLRLSTGERPHLSEAEACRVTYQCGIIGGTAADPARATEWPTRLARRAAALARQLAIREGDGGELLDEDREKTRWMLRRTEAERLHADIAAILPAVEALVGIARSVVSAAPLASLWPQILAFYRTWCVVPFARPDAATLLDDDLRPIADHPTGERLAGRDAVAYSIVRLRALRCPHGTFGEPRVFVGTPADALGLSFRAVRILGAVEGALPSSPQEDPILPDAERATLEAWMRERRGDDLCTVPQTAARVLRQTHEVFLAATAATARLALSAPRQWIDGTDRELAGIMLETAVALARPEHDGDEPELIPSLSRLRHDYIGASIEHRRRWDASRPSATHALLRAIARADLVAASTPGLAVPPGWLRGDEAHALYALPRVRGIVAESLADRLMPSDGMLGGHFTADALGLSGLAAARPISASALATLLACPYRFLLERVLHFHPPTERPPLREIGQPHYGSLVHRTLEQFLREHGPAFSRAHGSPGDRPDTPELGGRREWPGWPEWRRLATEVADGCFAAFLDEYPLLGEGVREAQRSRLRRDVTRFLESEWEDHHPLTFVGVEVPFGIPPERIDLESGRGLWVRGFIDRVDMKGARIVVRDVKTGRPKPRWQIDTGPDPDLQLGLYALVAPRLAETRDRQVVHAAYVFPAAAADRERSYAGADLEVLLTATRDWLDLAAALLEAAAFPHATEAQQCRYCSFRPLCGDDADTVSTRKLGHEDGVLARFAALTKTTDDPDESPDE